MKNTIFFVLPANSNVAVNPNSCFPKKRLTELQNLDIIRFSLNMAALVKRLTHRIVAPTRVGSIPTSRPINLKSYFFQKVSK